MTRSGSLRRITLAFLIVSISGAFGAAGAQTAVSPSGADTIPSSPGAVTSLPHTNGSMPTQPKSCVHYSTQSAARVVCAPGGIVWLEQATGRTFRPGSAAFGRGAGYYACARVSARACNAP